VRVSVATLVALGAIAALVALGVTDQILPAVDPRALHALGDRLAGTDAAPLAAFVDTVNAWLSARLDQEPREPARLVRVAQAWESINATARDAQEYNLERRPLVFSVFGTLADTVRG